MDRWVEPKQCAALFHATLTWSTAVSLALGLRGEDDWSPLASEWNTPSDQCHRAIFIFPRTSFSIVAFAQSILTSYLDRSHLVFGQESEIYSSSSSPAFIVSISTLARCTPESTANELHMVVLIGDP
ncbi:LRR receptor-like serine threonine-protein kinase [Musa troglodytarum]|uniref:LRR receptor-like serine threonine-protein kinase n=1 Tax=Musa troglodytarum TaxID=320322 RepID=A0A9E7IBC8_9LILI|nr:LRR receptor-like serine threonine-protein kinase [Musa troglodytarum]